MWEGKGDPSVYVYVRAKVCCTVVEYATICLVIGVSIGWGWMDGCVPRRVCRVGYTGEGYMYVVLL
jgi:hypothetical protein